MLEKRKMNPGRRVLPEKMVLVQIKCLIFKFTKVITTILSKFEPLFIQIFLFSLFVIASPGSNKNLFIPGNQIACIRSWGWGDHSYPLWLKYVSICITDLNIYLNYFSLSSYLSRMQSCQQRHAKGRNLVRRYFTRKLQTFFRNQGFKDTLFRLCEIRLK